MIKLLVHPFYRSNAGFFLFWAFLLYGGRQGHELIDFYYAIIMAQLKSPLFLTLSLLIWTLYHFKSFIFLRNSIVNYLPDFLHVFQKAPLYLRCKTLLICYLAVFAPVICYAVFMIIIGLLTDHFWQIVILLIYLLSIISLSVYYLNNTLMIKKERKIHPYFSLWLKSGGYMFFLVRFIRHEKKRRYLFLKAYSLGMFCLFFIFFSEDFSFGYFTLVLLLIAAGNGSLAYEIHHFIEGKLTLLRNIPVSMIKRGLIYIVTAIFLFLPEFLFMLVWGTNTLGIEVVLLCFGNLVFQYLIYSSVLYFQNQSYSEYMISLFVYTFFCNFVFASVNHLILLVFQICIATSVFAFHYWKYEFNPS